MTALVWLAVPLVITFVAIGIVMWVARPRGPVDAKESLAERERFTEAMNRQSQIPSQSQNNSPQPVGRHSRAKRRGESH
jgi:hypothetical protein